jgi:hypothetical protein
VRRANRRSEWLEQQLNEVRHLADLGTNTVYAELQLRRAMRRMAEEKFFEHSSPIHDYFIAEASLLLGRLIRLRGRHSEARAWIRNAASTFSGLINTGAIDTIDSAIRCAEHLTLIEKDEAITRSRLTGVVDLQASELAIRRQFQMIDGNVLFLDYDDHALEYLQRKAELISLRSGPEHALEFLNNSDFNKLSSERPEHNQVLRLLYLCEVQTEARNMDQAIQYADAAESFSIIPDSSFLKIMLNERRLRIAQLSRDPQTANEIERKIQSLRTTESIREVPKAEGTEGTPTHDGTI